jgi:small subunit ribosomal protein S5
MWAPDLGKPLKSPRPYAKALKTQSKNMITIPMKGTTIPHQIIGRFGAGRMLLMPAGEGTGVIAGGPARAVLELAGISDIRTKSLGSNNANNMVKATLAGLSELVSPQQVAAKRNKTIEEILG